MDIDMYATWSTWYPNQIPMLLQKLQLQTWEPPYQTGGVMMLIRTTVWGATTSPTTTQVPEGRG